LARFSNLVARPGLFLAVVLVSVGLRGASAWQDLWPTLLALSLANVALLVISIVALLERGWGGIGQRIIFGVLYVWVVAVALRILAKADAG